MIRRCPKCKSDDLQETGKRLYWRRLAICLVVILLCGAVYYSLVGEDVDAVVIIGVFGSMIMTGLSILLGIYYVVKALRTAKTTYNCKFCLNKFENPLLTDSDEPLSPLGQIRKRNVD